jgi:prepilin-type processing-associated H-X9-DG protein
VADENGRPMHSWRVAILPFIECQHLYDQYNFDEPWDSPNNMRVASQMPEILRCPSAPDTGDSNLTHYVVVLGDSPPGEKPDTMFGANRWTRMSEVIDGTSNTLLVVEVKEPVPWTQPDNDLRLSKMNFRINQGSRSIGSFHSGGANVLFADGSVHFLSNETDPEDLRLLLQPADGKAVRFGY